MNPPRSRILFSLMAAAVMVAGLATRSRWAVHLPPFVATYAGDALWSLLLYLALGAVFPRLATARTALLILSFSFLIEFSQLYQAAWINHLRQNRLAALVLGRGFLWTDFPCYSAGVLLGILIDTGWNALPKPPALKRNTPIQRSS